MTNFSISVSEHLLNTFLHILKAAIGHLSRHGINCVYLDAKRSSSVQAGYKILLIDFLLRRRHRAVTLHIILHTVVMVKKSKCLDTQCSAQSHPNPGQV